jgi:hypothetical protein
MADSAALHLVARALGVPVADGATTCSLCGASPFGAGGALAASYSGWADLAGGDGALCAGCSRIVSGRPGDDPPPLRTVNVLATPALIEYPDRARCEALLRDPPAAPFVLSWARSRQKHHLLRAGLSTPHALRIGSDDATILFRPAEDRPLLDAVAALRAWHAAAAVLAGRYHPGHVAAQGLGAFERAERLVAPYRGRALLDIACWCVAPAAGTRQEDTVIDAIDEAASGLLAAVARDSDARRADGIAFWSGFFARRIARFAHLPLAALLSRLLQECRCPPSSAGAQHVVAVLRELDGPSTDDISRAIRDRADMLVALAFAAVSSRRKA